LAGFNFLVIFVLVFRLNLHVQCNWYYVAHASKRLRSLNENVMLSVGGRFNCRPFVQWPTRPLGGARALEAHRPENFGLKLQFLTATW